jgi:simple sugar transport system ATP-binding protein
VRRSIDSCTLAEKQQILLARALSHHCRFLILDEPTAPLDAHESERLFTVVRRLQQQGIGVVFISHRIHELKAICDTLTVLRDGKMIESGPMAELSGEAIVEKMLGHELSDIYPPARPPFSDEILLRVEGLHDDALLKDISLHLRKGEILGIAGLAGAGKTELCKALFGASKSRVDRGELNNQAWRPRDPADSVLRGLALVPEERRKEGIFIEEPVSMNLAVSADNSFSRWSLFGHRQAWRWAEEVIARVGVRARGPGQVLRRLSGGNQQKIAIGKWLRGDAQVLIFDEPTKGVDVKAKTDLFQLIDGLAREGKGVIYASGEFAELVGLCDRICVLWDGRIVAEIAGAEARNAIARSAAQGDDDPRDGGGIEAVLRCYAAADSQRHRQRDGDNTDGDPGNQVTRKARQGVLLFPASVDEGAKGQNMRGSVFHNHHPCAHHLSC